MSPRKNSQIITGCIPALDFIKSLIARITEKYFKMVRYYGIYTKHHKQKSKLHKSIFSEKGIYICKFYNWQNMALPDFRNNSLKYPTC
ncbi:transposase [Roseburia hominis]